MKKIPSALLYIFGVNFLWEISQMMLYQDHTKGLGDFIKVHLKASLGDVLIFLLIYIAGVALAQNSQWFLIKNKFKYLLASLLGFIVAVAIEKYALATDRWAYGNLMPIIPFFKVGISPVLQMVILPSLTIFFLENLTKNSRR